jgi:hypothetical protein
MADWHLLYAGNGRHALLPDEDGRLMAVRRLADMAGADPIGFCIVDEHVNAQQTKGVGGRSSGTSLADNGGACSAVPVSPRNKMHSGPS